MQWDQVRWAQFETPSGMVGRRDTIHRMAGRAQAKGFASAGRDSAVDQQDREWHNLSGAART